MLEYILDKLLVLGQIYIVLGLLFTFTVLIFTTISRNKEIEFTFSEALFTIFLYPLVLFYLKNNKENE